MKADINDYSFHRNGLWGIFTLMLLWITVCVVPCESYGGAFPGLLNFAGKAGPGQPCAAGHSSYLVYDSLNGCGWKNSTGDNLAQVLWGAGQRFVPATALNSPVLTGGRYAPFSGNFQGVQHFCPSNTTSYCTLRSSTQEMLSVLSPYINSSVQMDKQEMKFGGYSGTLISSSNACYTLRDSKGYDWSFPDLFYSCKDAAVLPDTPAACYLNQSNDLSVEMGSLERGKIATVVASGTPGNIKKIFPVHCTRDAGVTVKTTIKFTTLTVNGSEVVATSTANLGVAIFYNGKLIGPSSTPVTETFEAGASERELEFQAVRNPDAALGDIPTGAFTASAVMVMTEQ